MHPSDLLAVKVRELLQWMFCSALAFAAVDRPINMGVQLVPRGRYEHAIALLDAVCRKYPFNESFIAGQVALPSA